MRSYVRISTLCSVLVREWFIVLLKYRLTVRTIERRWLTVYINPYYICLRRQLPTFSSPISLSKTLNQLFVHIFHDGFTLKLSYILCHPKTNTPFMLNTPVRVYNFGKLISIQMLLYVSQQQEKNEIVESLLFFLLLILLTWSDDQLMLVFCTTRLNIISA